MQDRCTVSEQPPTQDHTASLRFSSSRQMMQTEASLSAALRCSATRRMLSSAASSPGSPWPAGDESNANEIQGTYRMSGMSWLHHGL